MKILNTPKVGTSDIEVKLTHAVEQGSYHLSGAVFCEIETSKSTFDVELEDDGYIYLLHKIGDTISIGSPLAILSDIELGTNELKKKRKELFSLKENSNTEINSEIIFSKKALVLIEQNGIDRNVFSKDFVSEKDVLIYIDEINSSVSSNRSLKFEDNDLVLVGIGGHAGMCIDILSQDGRYKVVGFVDDSVQIDKRYNLKYLGTLESLNQYRDQGLKNVILGIGFVNNLKKRSLVYNNLAESFFIPTIIHPKAILEPTSDIADGCQIMAGAIIGSNVKVEKNCIINSGAIVSHDCFIDRDSHITPGAVLAGHVKVGKRVTIGMASSIYIGLSISDDKVVPNGKALFENV